MFQRSKILWLVILAATLAALPASANSIIGGIVANTCNCFDPGLDTKPITVSTGGVTFTLNPGNTTFTEGTNFTANTLDFTVTNNSGSDLTGLNVFSFFAGQFGPGITGFGDFMAGDPSDSPEAVINLTGSTCSSALFNGSFCDAIVGFSSPAFPGDTNPENGDFGVFAFLAAVNWFGGPPAGGLDIPFAVAVRDVTGIVVPRIAFTPEPSSLLLLGTGLLSLGPFLRRRLDPK